MEAFPFPLLFYYQCSVVIILLPRPPQNTSEISVITISWMNISGFVNASIPVQVSTNPSAVGGCSCKSSFMVKELPWERLSRLQTTYQTCGLAAPCNVLILVSNFFHKWTAFRPQILKQLLQGASSGLLLHGFVLSPEREDINPKTQKSAHRGQQIQQRSKGSRWGLPQKDQLFSNEVNTRCWPVLSQRKSIERKISSPRLVPQ